MKRFRRKKRAEIYRAIAEKILNSRCRDYDGVCIQLGNYMGGWWGVPDHEMRKTFPEFFHFKGKLTCWWSFTKIGTNQRVLALLLSAEMCDANNI